MCVLVVYGRDVCVVCCVLVCVVWVCMYQYILVCVYECAWCVGVCVVALLCMSVCCVLSVFVVCYDSGVGDVCVGCVCV